MLITLICWEETGTLPTPEELQLDVMTHLRFAKPNLDKEMVIKELQNWEVMEGQSENLLPEIGAFLDHALGDAEVTVRGIMNCKIE